MRMVGPNKFLIQQCCVILSFLIIEKLIAQPIQNDVPEVIDDENSTDWNGVQLGQKPIWNPTLPEYYSGPINYGSSSKYPSPIVVILIVIAFLSVVALFFAFCDHFIRYVDNFVGYKQFFLM